MWRITMYDTDTELKAMVGGKVVHALIPTELADHERDRPHGVELRDHAPERNAKSAGNGRIQVTPHHAANTGITDDQPAHRCHCGLLRCTSR